MAYAIKVRVILTDRLDVMPIAEQAANAASMRFKLFMLLKVFDSFL